MYNITLSFAQLMNSYRPPGSSAKSKTPDGKLATAAHSAMRLRFNSASSAITNTLSKNAVAALSISHTAEIISVTEHPSTILARAATYAACKARSSSHSKLASLIRKSALASILPRTKRVGRLRTRTQVSSAFPSTATSSEMDALASAGLPPRSFKTARTHSTSLPASMNNCSKRRVINVTHSSMRSFETSTGCFAAASSISERKSHVAPEFTMV
mmetsp:Transcript_7073/g.28572  ORF Transcript_7073/g.28572 Transcript_7073/m.28572 type:complete len:215 (-) Transcript_7073:2776-3420(-)